MNLRFPHILVGENPPKEQMMSCIIEYTRDNPETQCCPKMKNLYKRENEYFNAESIKHSIIFVLAVLVLKGFELFGIVLINSVFSFLCDVHPVVFLPLTIAFVVLLVNFEFDSKKDK